MLRHAYFFIGIFFTFYIFSFSVTATEYSRTAYFADYVEINEMPTGIFPLTPKEAEARPGSYIFYYDGKNRLVRMEKECIPQWNASGVYAQIINYNEKGQHSSTDYCPVSDIGNPVFRKLIHSRELVEFQNLFFNGARTVAPETFIGHDLPSNAGKSQFSKLKIERDKRGLVTRCMFLNAKEEIIYNTAYIAGYEFERDNLGRCTLIRFLDKQGKPKFNRFGTARQKIIYEESLTRINNLDMNGNPVQGAQGWASQTIERKLYNGINIVKHVFWNEMDELTVNQNPEYGYAYVSGFHNSQGRVYAIYYYDINEAFISFLPNGGSSHRIAYDERNRVTVLTCASINENQATRKYGTSQRISYNTSGQPVEIRYMNSGGGLLPGENQTSTVSSSYDEKSRILASANFNSRGRPVIGEFGWAACSIKYFDDKRKTVADYSDADKKPVSQIPARIVSHFDDFGNVVYVEYKNWNDEPINFTGEPYSARKYTYNESGNIIKEEFFGVDGKACAAATGFAAGEYIFDDKGNCVEYRGYGTDGKIIAGKNNYAIIKYKYNRNGRCIETAFYDKNGKPCLNDEKIAGWNSDYDAAGNEVARTYFDVNGNQCKLKGNLYSFYEQTFDRFGNQLSIMFLDPDGALAKNESDIAIFKTKYDFYNAPILYDYYGTGDGSSCKKYPGVDHVQEQLDSSGQTIKVNLFDAEDNPITKQ